MKQAFEAWIGKRVPKSTMYRLLDRHHWRKIISLPRHPKANQVEQERLKKTLRRRFKRQSQRALQKTADRSC